MSYILPGEMYEGRVEICGGKFIVLKRHVSPLCEWPEDPDPDEYKEIEIEHEYKMAA